MAITKITEQNIPEDWYWSTLGEVSDVIAGNPAPQGKEYFKNGSYPFVRVQDMGRLGAKVHMTETHDLVNDKAIKKLRLFPSGSILFTKSGASTLLNQRAILGSDMYVVSHIAGAIPKESITSKWLYYWMKLIDFNSLAHATTLPSLPLSRAKEIPVPVAPKEQQEGIVEEIEKQFSRLDEAVTSLKRAKANLKRYKAAVLKAAVEGKLTEEWRKQNPNVEPAAELLKRILAERRRNWEEIELAKMSAKGKEPKDDRWKERYQELNGIDNGFPMLPKKWIWCRLGQISDVIGGITKNRKRETYEIKITYLRVANVYANELRLGKVSKIGLFDSEIDKALLRKNDLLIVEGNGSKEQIGRVAIWDGTIDPCVHQNHLIKVRFYIEQMAQYVLWWLLSSPGRRFVDEVASSTSGLYTLSISKVSNLPVPLPPLDEQIQIVAVLDPYFSSITESHKIVETNQLRSNRYRQAILSKAFRLTFAN